LPTFSIDIPSGGGKTYLTPDFIEKRTSSSTVFKGFDGIEAEYFNPDQSYYKKPYVDESSLKEWATVQKSKR
jgi:lysine 2,3-aminomutase